MVAIAVGRRYRRKRVRVGQWRMKCVLLGIPCSLEHCSVKRRKRNAATKRNSGVGEVERFGCCCWTAAGVDDDDDAVSGRVGCAA